MACALVLTSEGDRLPVLRDLLRSSRGLAWAVAAFGLVVVVTTATSTARADSFFGRYERYDGVLPLLVHLGLAVVVVRLVAPRVDRLLPIAGAIVGGAAVCGAYVALQVAGLDPLDWREPSGRVVQYSAGTLGNSNFAGAQLAIALVLVPLLVRFTTGRVRIAVVLAAASCAAGAALTESRGALLAAGAGGAVLAVVHGGAVIRRWPRTLVVATAVIGVVAVVGLVVATAQTSLGRTESLSIRFRQWRAAIEITRDHPVVGTGPDTFQLHYPAYRELADGRELGLQIADKPHNVLLEHASSSGVPGAASYAALVVATVLTAVAALRRADERVRWYAGSFLAAAVAYVAQATFSIDVPSLALVWWLIVVGVVATRYASSEPAPGAHRRTGSTRMPALVALGIVAVLAWGVSRPWRADWASARGDDAKAVKLNPYQPVLWLNRGASAVGTLARAGDRAQASDALRDGEDAFERALGLQPRSVYATMGLARLYANAARLDPVFFERADAQYARAAELDPVDWQVHDDWALMLNAWANATGGDEKLRRRALSAFERVVEIRPDERRAWENIERVAGALGDTAKADAARAEAARLAGSSGS